MLKAILVVNILKNLKVKGLNGGDSSAKLVAPSILSGVSVLIRLVTRL